MKSFYIFGAVLGGALIGYAIGHENARRSVLRDQAERIEREIQEARDIFDEKLKALETETEPEVAPQEPKETRTNPVMSSESRVTFEHYEKFAKAKEKEAKRLEELKKPYDGPVEDADGSEVYEDYEDEDDDEFDLGLYHPDNEPDQDSYERPEPFLITVDDFMAPVKRYEEISLQYFKEDGVVMDSGMMPVPKPEEFVGDFLKVFDNNLQGDTDVLFIRNNRMQVDVELIVEEDETLNEALTRWKNRAAMKKKEGRR